VAEASVIVAQAKVLSAEIALLGDVWSYQRSQGKLAPTQPMFIQLLLRQLLLSQQQVDRLHAMCCFWLS